MSPTNNQTMSPEQRREQILIYLYKHDRCSVSELSQLLGVSEVTVRKDLDILELQGVLTRWHGGAVASGRGRLELHFGMLEQEHLEEKRRIAQTAATLVESGTHIFLDASTTALQLARLIKDRQGLTVVTNGLYTALELSFCRDIMTIVVGGFVRHRSGSLIGNLSQHLIERLRVDIGFFGARGITAKDGLMEADIAEAQLKQWMVSVTEQVVGVVDASKFGDRAFNVFALPHEIDRIITDVNAPTSIVDELRTRGITVDLV